MNSAETVQESLDLANMLVKKTVERKLEWKVSNEADAFLCELGSPSEQEAVFLIKREEYTYHFKMTDAQGNDLVEVSVEEDPKYGFNLPTEAALVEQLKVLFEEARRTALQVEQKVDRVMSLLNKL